MFEIAIRKPRKQLKHILADLKASIYGLFLLAFKYHGEPPDRKDFNMLLLAFSILLTLDFMMMINFLVEIVSPTKNGESSYTNWGWAFIFVYFGLPIVAPLLGFFSALWKDVNLMKELSNINALMMVFNIPLSILSCLSSQADPTFILLFGFFMIVKMAMSIVSGKIR